MRKFFGRRITKDLQKQITVLHCDDTGNKCTQTIYSSLLDMSEQERLEYITNALMQCDNDFSPEQIAATRQNIKNILNAKLIAHQK